HKKIEEQLDAYHFAEDVTFQERTSAIFLVQGDQAADYMNSFLPDLNVTEPWQLNHIQECIIENVKLLVINHSQTGDPGFMLITDSDSREKLRKTLLDRASTLEITEFYLDVLDVMRIESGQIRFGSDFDEKTLLLELDLGEQIYNLDKGCYPGQEVVARVVNKGKIARKIVGVTCEDDHTFHEGMDVTFDGKSVGVVKSSTWSPTLEKTIVVANLKRDYTDHGAEFVFEIDGSPVQCKIARLPFYFSPSLAKEVESLYNLGMQYYHEDNFEKAEEAFTRALKIKHDSADSWEALAMSIEKMGDLDRAIVLNRKYAELDPLAVMARTNLSRLYMFKGFKERAEEEQAKATTISFKLKALKNKQDKGAQQQFEKQQQQMHAAELERKLAVFKQVLELDADDEIANFGAGKLYLDSGQFEKAIHHLQTVIRVNPEYSAAYDALAKAFVKNGNFDDARSLLNKGIAVAEEKGDLMPANSMKELLNSL
ncbi:MAG: tetratricopeptide repeat protein, partial [Chlorobiales bacterium]|nr:tetratricopeptide repeat protein [Chlorobiales bacterium]